MHSGEGDGSGDMQIGRRMNFVSLCCRFSKTTRSDSISEIVFDDSISKKVKLYASVRVLVRVRVYVVRV